MAELTLTKMNKRKLVDDLTSLPRSKREKPNDFSLLEDFCFKCPLVGEMILEKIDSQSLISCKIVSRQMYGFLENERHLWKRMIRHHAKNFKEFKDQWKMVIKTPVENLKELATTVVSFFSTDPKHYGHQWAPIHIAAQKGCLKLSKYILDKTGDIDSRRKKDGWTTLHIAVVGRNFEVCQFLVDNMTDKNPKSLTNWTPLHMAAMFGSLKISKLIIQNVESKNPVDSNGRTPLHESARFNHLKVCKLIVKNISNKNPADNIDGSTPLHYAAKLGYLKICKLIMKQNIADKNPAKPSGMTPLHMAAQEGHLKICKMFLENIDEKNPGDVNGNTPLHFAAQMGNFELCDFITEYLDDKNPVNNHGVTPMDIRDDHAKIPEYYKKYWPRYL